MDNSNVTVNEEKRHIRHSPEVGSIIKQKRSVDNPSKTGIINVLFLL